MSITLTEAEARHVYAKKSKKLFSDEAQAAIARDKTGRSAQRLVRSIANDCAPLPDVVNPERREDTFHSLRLFCEHYFPMKFNLGWSTGQLNLIEEIEKCVKSGGGMVACAMPRGSGKTSLTEAGALWALFHGYKRFILCLGAKADLGKHLFHSIKSEIENNELLAADFPEICHPFAFAERNPIKYRFQTYKGIPTLITYQADNLSLPQIEESKVSGSYVMCSSITAGLRGLKRTTPDGRNIRPDFVIIDDPQTDKSAKSPAQTEARERTIQGAIMGLAGPKSPMTVVMPCTVIQEGDLADRFLDRERKPEWRGQRTKLLEAFPTNMDLWTEYLEIKNADYRSGGNGMKGTEFYKIKRAEMDAGAIATWDERFDPPLQISAIQFAMDLYFRDPIAFASEYQNEPISRSNGDDKPSIELKAEDIIRRLSGLEYGTAPRETVFVTSGIDIQKDCLYWLTVAWTLDFGGVIVDYGVCPEQPREYFDSRNVPLPLSSKWPGLLQSPLTFKALEWILLGPLGRQYARDENTDLIPVEAAFVDANWNLTADAVYQFSKSRSSKVFPCHARGVGAAMLPMDQWAKKAGEIVNKANWRIRPTTLGAGRGRHIMYDANFWKSRIGERLVAPSGTPNALNLYGKSSMKHQLLADHLSAEMPIRTHGRGRDVDEWRTKAHTSENHWFDCLVMAAVAASKCGLELHEITSTGEMGVGPDTIVKEGKAVPLPPTVRRVAAPAPPRKQY